MRFPSPFLKAFCVFLAFAWVFVVPTQAQSTYNHKTINPFLANSGITQELLGTTSGLEHTRSSNATDFFATNEIFISYTTDAPATLPGALSLTGNILNIPNYAFAFTGAQSAAYVSLANTNYSDMSVNTDNFNLSLTNNTTNLQGNLNNSSQSIYGALFETTNSALGVGNVSNNLLAITTTAQSSSTVPGLIGGAIHLTTTRKDIISTADVLNNAVTVNVNANNVLASNIFGGKVDFTINQTNGNKTYQLTPTIDGNSVSLTQGTFTQNTIAGGAMAVDTDATYTATLSGNVQNNQITATGGTYNQVLLVGGQVALEGNGLSTSSNLPISIHNNTVSITGGTFNDSVIAGATSIKKMANTQDIQGTISNNQVTISGTPVFNGTTTLLGGYSTGTNTISNNTLSLQTKNVSVYGVNGFDTYQFAVADANASDTYLTVAHGNGQKAVSSLLGIDNQPNGALDLTNATLNWQDGGRPVNLSVGQSLTLIQQTGKEGITGIIANNAVPVPIVVGSDIYSYKLVQSGNAVYLLHHDLNVAGDWTQNATVSAGEFSGGDSTMEIGGKLIAAQVTVAGNSFSSASLTANELDVTAQNTLLSLTNTAANQVHFNTVSVGDGYTLFKTGNGFYSFDNMTLTGNATVNTLDAFNPTNTVTLAGGATPTFNQINLGQGSTLSISGGTYNFNALTVFGDSTTLAGDLNAANKNLTFYLADTTSPSDTVLNVTGATDVTNSTIQVGIPGTSSVLKKEDQVVLVQSGSAITGTPATLTGVGIQGLLLTYNFDLSVVNNQLLATVTKAGLSEESKSFLEGRAASLAFVGQGADFLADNVFENAVQAAALQDTQRLALFTSFAGGKSRYETGSHIDVNGFNAAVGLAHDISIFDADFMVSSLIEYGNGSYHSYNAFPSGSLKGNGNTEYIGLGVLTRWFGPKNTYLDFSVRAGQVSTDFKAPVFYANQNATYDYNSFYYGGHFGLGYTYNLNEDFTVDFYGRYLLTQQQGKFVTISSGDEIHFHDSTSSRLRAGIKAALLSAAHWKPYAGIGYDYELAGKAKASAYNMSWNAPSLQGGSGVGELGITFTQSRWIVSLEAEGYVGEREGVTGNFNVGYKF